MDISLFDCLNQDGEYDHTKYKDLALEQQRDLADED